MKFANFVVTNAKPAILKTPALLVMKIPIECYKLTSVFAKMAITTSLLFKSALFVTIHVPSAFLIPNKTAANAKQAFIQTKFKKNVLNVSKIANCVYHFLHVPNALMKDPLF